MKLDDTAEAHGKKWCAICATYTEHDTVHHDSQGRLKPGDMAIITEGVALDIRHMVGKRGRVEQVRGDSAAIAIPGKTGTFTVAVPLKNLRAD